MTRSNCRPVLISAFLTLLFSLTTTASVPVAVEVDARIVDLPRGGQTLTIRVTSVSLPVDRGLVQVGIAGDYLDSAAVTKQISLKAGETEIVRLPIETNSAGELSSVAVRVLRDNDTTPIVVQELYVTGVAERARLIRPDEAQQIVAARGAQQAETRAKAMAEEEVRSVLARGGRPVMNQGDRAKLSIVERAWNDAVQRLAPRNESRQRVRSDCGVFNQLSPRNHDWGQFSGSLWYQEQNGQVIQPRAAGQSVGLQAPVEFTDGCGNYQLLSTTYWANTYGNGIFTFPQNVISYNQPPDNPGTGVTVIFHKTGTLVSSNDMSEGVITLTNPADFPMIYGTLQPKFTEGNSGSFRYWFRWNDEAMVLEQQWASRYMYLTFRSAYDPYYTSSLAGCHCQYSPGLVTFGPGSFWNPAWVQAHEMGHEWDLQRSNTAIGGAAAHNICSPASDPYTAFHEGFADWFGSNFETEGRAQYFQVDPYGELLPCPSGAQPGYSREGNVTAYLWDVFDDVNSAPYDNGLDTMSLSLNQLGNWAAYSDFPAYYNAWTNNGVFGSYQSVADALRTPNQVTGP